jgi:TolB-like protein/DNA-binding winged helix-turn-helix (wHTH) protein
MEQPATTPLRIGDWGVNPASGEISRNGETTRLDARAMRLLIMLAQHRGDVVSIDDLLDQVWSGVTVSQDSVYQAVTSLRRALGDDPRQPAYIATVPRLGYRMVARVSPLANEADETDETRESPNGSTAHPDRLSPPPPALPSAIPVASSPASRRFSRFGGIALAALLLAVAAFLLIDYLAPGGHRSASPVSAAQPQNSVAVLPFLDLTEGMKNEEFADGITEELIDKLSKIPGLRVPSATSSFYFKGKQVPVAEIAKSLAVAYVLDGSLRKSGTWVRVDVRLVRGENGYVLWSETYDQPMSNILGIQDSIATAVAKALKTSIAGQPAP